MSALCCPFVLGRQWLLVIRCRFHFLAFFFLVVMSWLFIYYCFNFCLVIFGPCCMVIGDVFCLLFFGGCYYYLVIAVCWLLILGGQMVVVSCWMLVIGYRSCIK